MARKSLKNWKDCYIKVHCSGEFSSGAKGVDSEPIHSERHVNNMPLAGVEMNIMEEVSE